MVGEIGALAPPKNSQPGSLPVRAPSLARNFNNLRGNMRPLFSSPVIAKLSNVKMFHEPTSMTKIDSLINEIQDGELSGPTKRQLKALTRITELFVAGSGRHSGQQLELFDEVFKALVAVIELKARAKLA